MQLRSVPSGPLHQVSCRSAREGWGKGRPCCEVTIVTTVHPTQYAEIEPWRFAWSKISLLPGLITPSAFLCKYVRGLLAWRQSKHISPSFGEGFSAWRWHYNCVYCAG